jgi:hypothetical protein
MVEEEVPMWKVFRRGGAMLAWLLLGGCNLQAPQLQALERDLSVDQRERLRTYDTCKGRSQKPANLDECMKAEGYQFVSASAQDYRASECWDHRYDGGWPPAYCYNKGTAK